MGICDTEERFLRLNDSTKSFIFKTDPRTTKVKVVLSRVGSDEECKVPHDLSNGELNVFPDKKSRNLDAGWYELLIYQNCCPCIRMPVLIEDDCGIDFDAVDEYTDADACVTCPEDATGGATRARRDLPRCTPTRDPDPICPAPPMCPDDQSEFEEYKPEYPVL